MASARTAFSLDEAFARQVRTLGVDVSAAARAGVATGTPMSRHANKEARTTIVLMSSTWKVEDGKAVWDGRRLEEWTEVIVADLRRRR